MKRGAHSAGFTIVETMIVLAITGALFVMIASTISGRQRKSEFTQAIGDIRAQIQQTANEVQAGYYANMGNFSCDKTGIKSGNTEQGKNGDCLFIGKVIMFGGANTDRQPYTIYPVTGLRTLTPPASLSVINPTVIAPANGAASVPDDSITKTLSYGLNVVKMASGSTGGIGAVGFMSALGNATDTGNYQNGAVQIDVYGLKDTTLNASNKMQAASQINDSMRGGKAEKNPTRGVRICFESGGTDQYGLISIGGYSNGRLAVDMKILDKSVSANKDCGL